METKTVRVWIGNDFIELDYEINSEMEKDEIYEYVVDDVFSQISIEIL